MKKEARRGRAGAVAGLTLRPEGNLSSKGWMRPAASRFAIQQSSMFTYW
jgi:hypothetical protein